MFLIAGISPRIKQIDHKPRRCPACGLHQAYYKQVDHYFSLFFIPIFRVKKGEPILICERCEKTDYEFSKNYAAGSEDNQLKCKTCASLLQRDYKYRKK